jgi:hypothetical protein
MIVSVVVLAAALYVLLKPVEKNLALLALCWRLAEAILGGVTVILGFVALQFSDSNYYSFAFSGWQERRPRAGYGRA